MQYIAITMHTNLDASILQLMSANFSFITSKYTYQLQTFMSSFNYIYICIVVLIHTD